MVSNFLFFACCFRSLLCFLPAVSWGIRSFRWPQPGQFGTYLRRIRSGKRKVPAKTECISTSVLTGTKIGGKYRIAGLQKVLQNEKKGSEAFWQGGLQFFPKGLVFFYGGCNFRKGVLHLHHLPDVVPDALGKFRTHIVEQFCQIGSILLFLRTVVSDSLCNFSANTPFLFAGQETD